MTAVQKKLQHIFPELSFEHDKPLAPLTYFKIGGSAECYLATNSKDEIARVVKFCHDENIRVTMLGGGSNVVVSDAGVTGLVLNITHNEVVDTGKRESDAHIIEAGAGIKTALLVSKTVAMGFTGLEYFLGVPGTLGGAVYNNSHYFQDLIDEFIFSVEAIDHSGQIRRYSHAECEFAYEASRFQKTKEVIFSVEFVLTPSDQAASQRKIREATEYRAMTQPLGPPSSGCIFQNVPNSDRLRALFPQFAEKSHVPGGFIIDQAGLKGERMGGVVVSDKHAAWFINQGDATAQDVKALIQKVKKDVKLKFGIDLQEEVFYLE